MNVKKTTATSIVGEHHLAESPYQSLYRLMVLLDVDPQDIVVNYCNSDIGEAAIGVPSIETVIDIGGNGDSSEFRNAGWVVVVVNPQDVEAFHRVYSAMSAITIAQYHAQAKENVKNTSSQEEKLLSALLRAGIPVPDRNYRMLRDDGSELTVPDFTWEKQKVAFFLDGLYWHSAKNNKEIIDDIRQSKDSISAHVIVESSKSKLEKDAAIRSELAVRGWRVLSCTDRDIDSPLGVEKQVSNIARALSMAQQPAVTLDKASADEILSALEK